MRLTVLAIVGLLLASVPAAAESPEQWTGQHAATTTAQTIVATDAAAWQRMITLAGQSIRPIPTTFDTAHKTGVGIFLGQRNTSGHGVVIVSMAPRDDKLIVTVDEKVPDMNAMVAQVLTSPWLILLIDKPAQPVAVEPRFHAN